ncbi:copper resistance protein NlpE [Flavobacterium frigoris]|uniref:Lipoprotein n=1 Tax=Flavobacterium frigoris (strain PS1) TaxID=1086011 RepID=H7FU27_FLAFP|nr:copper resistance protein NlpE [Flavobacterium frigoris]EIA07879.1 lipoprotein [Flavobacterium frigoris PS1]
MKKNIVTLVIVSLSFFSCKKEIKTVEAKKDTIADVVDTITTDMHNSQNALDWPGTYKGMTPCADCEGIETELILNKDLTFVLKTKYLGKEKENVFEEKGDFTWNASGSIISLKGISYQYKVGENTLTQLDLDGKASTGLLADMYILKKYN